ncbi:nagb/rpia/CoA transferase-like protein [Hortaea werneckii]|nr:nagb/rpia/CoA transferase-like protein [Hortaea werneckii]
MPSPTAVGSTPSLTTFLKSLKQNDIETSIEFFIALLKRRQIRNSRPCAIATVNLLLRVVGEERIKDASTLITRIRDVGRRLVAAQPREMAVGNIVRRVLEVVRERAEADLDAAGGDSEAGGASGATTPTLPAPGEGPTRPALPSRMSEFTPLHGAHALPEDIQTYAKTPTPMERPLSSGLSGAGVESNAAPAAQRPGIGSAQTSYAGQAPSSTSLFSILQHPTPGSSARSPYATPPGGTQSPSSKTSPRKDEDSKGEKLDIKAEVITGIVELQQELEDVDDEIASFALDHIHSGEMILTHGPSQTVQKFLTTVARKRKFTVVHAEAFPNDHESTHSTIVNGGQGEDDERWKPLTSMGITVILVPDSAVFALMSRINKVLLAPHTVLANGSLLATSGASTISLAAKTHRVPVVVLSGVYKLSPVYPFDTDELIEYGDPGKVVSFSDGRFMDKVDVMNPVYDWVDAEGVDLYVTNLGACAPSYLYRVVADHYRVEDIDLSAKPTDGGAVKAA